MTDKDREQAEYLANRLKKRRRQLSSWLKREGISCYRAYDVDIPEIPLAIDVYGDNLLISLYERPYEKDEAEERAWLSLMADAASGALSVERSRVHTRMRKRQKGDSQYEREGSAGTEEAVREGGLSFLVNLSDYLDSGLFLDHRRLRSVVRSLSGGKRVLNLFCYTGSFSVYAAAGGASEVVSVDLSRVYLDWASRNAALNGLSGPQRFVRADANEFLAQARRSGERFGVIVLDPPTFSNSKAMKADFDVNRDWPELVRSAASLLEPGGILFFSTNSRRLKFDASLLPGLSVRDITEESIDQDFRDRKIHRAWRIERPQGL